MAYCRFFRKITKYSPHYLMFGAPCLIPPIDCMYETLQNHLLSTPSDYNGKLKKDLQLCHKLLQSNMEVAKEAKKPYYDRKQQASEITRKLRTDFQNLYNTQGLLRRRNCEKTTTKLNN